MASVLWARTARGRVRLGRSDPEPEVGSSSAWFLVYGAGPSSGPTDTKECPRLFRAPGMVSRCSELARPDPPPLPSVSPFSETQMQIRTISVSAFAVLLGLASCSPGSGASSLTTPSCDDGSGQPAANFCVVSCNLGCGASGCAVTEIAQNQPITFAFNKPVDPASANFTTIQIKTDTGEEPVGQFLVNGNQVTFAPEVQVVGSSSFFGFKNGASYRLVLRQAGPGSASVRSTSGDVIVRETVCNLRVSRGIVDLDEQPPRATLVTPSVTQGAPRDSAIVLEFSEILDAGPFQAPLSGLPVLFRVRGSRAAANGRECDPGSSPLSLRGSFRLVQDVARQRTIVNFTPGSKLPAESCVQVEVTTRVRDVAGTAARAQLFQFVVENAVLERRELTEVFSSQQQLDGERSAGEWSGGAVTPSRVGGSGRHGEFNAALGQALGGEVYLWDLDRDERGGVRGFVIPASATMNGVEELVTDGEFHFSRMVVPAGQTIRFVGSKSVKLLVRGRCEIAGRLDLTGLTPAAAYPAKPATARDYPGQPGSLGGAGGGRGGRGGNLEATMGLPGNFNKEAFDGENGADAVPDLMHGYREGRLGTGGRGAKQWPDSGRLVDVRFTFLGVMSVMAPSPGGGGGLSAPGGGGRNESQPIGLRQGDTPASSAFDVTALTPRVSSLVHFLLGGAGGGGGGAHTFYRVLGDFFLWNAGAAGGGGGGAIALRVGRELITTVDAVIDVSGGGGGTGGTVREGPATPGGGGSGGTILMQSGRDLSLAGRSRALGGAGGQFEFQLGLGQFDDRMRVYGGAGAAGYVRVEAPTQPDHTRIGQLEPPAAPRNVGVLTDRDKQIGLQSTFYLLQDVVPPRWTGYEVEAIVDNQRIVYSDDPTRGSGVRATPLTQAVGFVVQGTRDDDGVPLPPTGPWREFVGAFGGASNLNQDTATAVRFQLILNYERATTIDVKRVSIYYEN